MGSREALITFIDTQSHEVSPEGDRDSTLKQSVYQGK